MKNYILLIFFLSLSINLSMDAADSGSSSSSSSSESSSSSPSDSDSPASLGQSGLEGYNDGVCDNGHVDLAARHDYGLSAAGAVGSSATRNAFGRLIRAAASASGGLYLHQAGLGNPEDRRRTFKIARQAGQTFRTGGVLSGEIAQQFRNREIAVSDTAQFLLQALKEIESAPVAEAKDVIRATKQFVYDHRERLLTRAFEIYLTEQLAEASSKISAPPGDDTDESSSDS